MEFPTRIHGIPCKCRVLDYQAYIPMRIYGVEREDAAPPEDSYFEYEILDRKGYQAPWLAKHITNTDDERLFKEFLDIERTRIYRQ